MLAVFVSLLPKHYPKDGLEGAGDGEEIKLQKNKTKKQINKKKKERSQSGS
jgi:hypothetical protein